MCFLLVSIAPPGPRPLPVVLVAGRRGCTADRAILMRLVITTESAYCDIMSYASLRPAHGTPEHSWPAYAAVFRVGTPISPAWRRLRYYAYYARATRLPTYRRGRPVGISVCRFLKYSYEVIRRTGPDRRVRVEPYTARPRNLFLYRGTTHSWQVVAAVQRGRNPPVSGISVFQSLQRPQTSSGYSSITVVSTTFPV